MNVINAPELYLKAVKMANFVLYIFFPNFKKQENDKSNCGLLVTVGHGGGGVTMVYVSYW